MIFRPGQLNVLGSNPRMDIWFPDEPWWLAGGMAPTDCVLAYQPVRAASLAVSYVNQANPGTNDAAPGVAPTLSSGWVFNGTTQYLTTALSMAVATTWSALVRYTTSSTTGTRSVFGAGGTGNQQFGYIVSISGSTQRWSNQNLLGAAGVGSGSHVQAFAGQTAYTDGSSVGSLATTTAAGTAQAIFIGADNWAGAENFFAGTIQAFAVYNMTLSAAQITAVTNAMNAL